MARAARDAGATGMATAAHDAGSIGMATAVHEARWTGIATGVAMGSNVVAQADAVMASTLRSYGSRSRVGSTSRSRS